MSTYYKLTKNPVTDEWENAIWIDDYFGPHHYGVRFKGPRIYDPREIKLETKESNPLPNDTTLDATGYPWHTLEEGLLDHFEKKDYDTIIITRSQARHVNEWSSIFYRVEMNGVRKVYWSTIFGDVEVKIQ